jgi:hypothetical protein
MSPAGLLAEVQVGTLLRSLAIALVVVSPLAWWKVRQVRRVRAARQPAAPAPEVPPATRPRLEDVIAAIGALAEEVATGADEPRCVLVPSDVTVDGREPPDGVVDLLVRDALRRSGLVATGEVDTPEGRLIECAPVRELRA